MKNQNLVGKVFNVLCEDGYKQVRVVADETNTETNIKGQRVDKPTEFYAIGNLQLKFTKFEDVK